MSFKYELLVHLLFTAQEYVVRQKSKSFSNQHCLSLVMAHCGTLAVCTTDTLLQAKTVYYVPAISFCSCLSPEEPDRVLCGCGRQQHAPALRQYAARTAHHHYLKQA